MTSHSASDIVDEYAQDGDQEDQASGSGDNVPLSKNAQKRARKAAFFAERKLERRAREREAKRAKKRQRAERAAAGEEELDNESPRKKAKAGTEPGKPFDARVAVDLGFDDKMSEKEVASLCSQLAYTYSANRRTPTPFTSLLFTSLSGRTLTRLESQNDAAYKRWVSTEWWNQGYDGLWSTGTETVADAASGSQPDAFGVADSTVQAVRLPHASAPRAQAPKSSVVYLTADSEEVLEELKEGETYIIGGICDHNRYKNLCLTKARESGIRAAQLPIGRFLGSLPTRKVLTVNQVFEILVRWVETRDWEKALYSVIPKRKFQDASGKRNAEDEKEIAVGNREKDGAEEDKE